MATQIKNGAKISTPSGDKTVEEIKADFSQAQKIYEFYKAVEQSLQLINPNKTQNRSYSTYDKDKLRSFLRNPKSNEKNLRNLSIFLYRYCYAYRKLIWYCATMYDMNAISVVPNVDITKKMNFNKIKKNWYATASKVQRMTLDQALLPMFVTAWREDTAYGYIFDDDQTFFIYMLDGNYCKVTTIDGGTLRYAFDFSWFNSHSDELAYMPKEFQKKFAIYQKDSSQRWQELEYQNEICLKVNVDDLTMDFPPYAASFQEIIDLVDLNSIQAVKNDLSIYKLLVARLQPLSGTNQADDFEIDIKTALKYYDKFAKELPDEVASCISPMPIETIEFKGTTSDDVDMISNSTANLFKNTTNSTILYSSDSTATISKLKAIADENMILSPLIGQIQAWLNIYLNYAIGTDHAHVKFIKVGPYTREDRKKEFLNDAQYSLPTKLATMSLNGFTPLEGMSLATLENDVLDLSELWEPLQSSHTQSGKSDDLTTATGGRPKSSTDDLTDDGERSRDSEA